MTITNQGKLEYIPLDEELAPTSEGKVTDKGVHVPDLNLIDAYNALPTIAGYSSFFGQGEYLDATSLPSFSVQEIITFRTLHGDNIQLAFCREGLYLRSLAGDATGVRTETATEITIDMPEGQAKWIQVLTPEFGPTSPWELWTFPIIENEMYIYIQGLTYIAKLTSVEQWQVIFEKLDPTYVIGTDEVYKFVITGEDDSEGDDNYKAVEINTDSGLYLGTYKHYTHSASLVDEVKLQTEAAFMNAFSAEVEETDRTITDIDAFIPVDKTRDYLNENIDLSHNGEDEDLIITIEGGESQLPSDTNIEVDIYKIELHNNCANIIDSPYFQGNFTLVTDDYTDVIAASAYSISHKVRTALFNNAGGGNYQCCYSKESRTIYNIYGAYPSDIYETIYWEQDATKSAPQISHDGSWPFAVTITITKITPETKPVRALGKTYPIAYKAYFNKSTWLHWDSGESDETNRLDMLTRLEAISETHFNNSMYVGGGEDVEPGCLRSNVSYIEELDNHYIFEYTLLATNWAGEIAYADHDRQWEGNQLVAPTYFITQEEFDTEINIDYEYKQGTHIPTLEVARVEMYLSTLSISGRVCIAENTFQLDIDAESKVFTVSIGDTQREIIENFIDFILSFTNVISMTGYETTTLYTYATSCLPQFLTITGRSITWTQLTGPADTVIDDYGPSTFDNVTLPVTANIKLVNIYIEWPVTSSLIAIGTDTTSIQTTAAALVSDFNTNVGPNHDITAYIKSKTSIILIPNTYSYAKTLASKDILKLYVEGHTLDLFYGDGNVGTYYESTDTPYTYAHLRYEYQIPVATGIRLEGFKTKSLTELVAQGKAYFVPFEHDSNDIAATIRTKLIADPLFGSTIGVLEEVVRAQAEVDYTLTIKVRIFDNSIPTLTLTQDGTTLWTQTSVTDDVINLMEVEGIYAARGRLGYWNRENAIGWSSYNNIVDFIPSSNTRANQIAVKALKGKIVRCIGYDNGFIIYATGNIARAEYIGDQYTFRFTIIEEAEGVTDPRHVIGYKNLHYYWGTKGLTTLSPEQETAKLALTELSDWINKYRYPITLALLSSRYLIIYLQDRVRKFSNRDTRSGKSEITAGAVELNTPPRSMVATAHGTNLYPFYKRALIFDTLLSKWGTCDQDIFNLTSLSPLNQSGYQVTKDYELSADQIANLQTELVMVQRDLSAPAETKVKCYIANTFPTTSYVLFGKYATHRERFTKLSAINVEFVDYPDAEIEVERSIDGAKIVWAENWNTTVLGLRHRVYPNITGKWLNILVKGHYHLKRLMTRGQNYGRDIES